MGRAEQRRAGRVGAAFLEEAGVAGDEAAVADDPARAEQHRGRRVTATGPAAGNKAEVEVALRRRRGRGRPRPPHGEELGGVHVDERPGAAEGMAEVDGVGDEALERRRPRAALRQPPAGEAVAEELLHRGRGDLHEC